MKCKANISVTILTTLAILINHDISIILKEKKDRTQDMGSLMHA